ncbi:hypothetical protein B005_4973 [Nocardiopsis alba ATCC BAA-2165]|uniref:Uncharacterized protein n=1 Tax=Nocardiopsis alba (strain ATCC BAA-2165 / BE74) TaxID=1205910 RepID=J7L9D4_NOCAA|nr:hypothetical protein B005_4973 [Nocardiopsis alba ATCC BAA-2165]
MVGHGAHPYPHTGSVRHARGTGDGGRPISDSDRPVRIKPQPPQRVPKIPFRIPHPEHPSPSFREKLPRSRRKNRGTRNQRALSEYRGIGMETSPVFSVSVSVECLRRLPDLRQKRDTLTHLPNGDPAHARAGHRSHRHPARNVGRSP